MHDALASVVDSGGGPLDGSVYAQYLYSYPHKLAYRSLVPRSLGDVWGAEDARALFLYVHVPFCEQRCGFCNLFTLAVPGDRLESAYLGALERQASRVAAAVGEGARFARFAIGGGTPTYLDAGDLERLFDLLARRFGLDPRSVPGSVEVSPETATPEKLDVLAGAGVARVSMGVQSFLAGEVDAIRRRQEASVVTRALGAIRARPFATLNLDLMYGLPGQTVESFVASIRAALEWAPEELYLYPLYVRELTLLGKRRSPTRDDPRLELYRAGRALLLSEGYEQRSMRMFRRTSAAQSAGPAYACQRDGMVGIGCGARSYTAALHYSTPFAVGVRGVRDVLERYVNASEADHDRVAWGVELDPHERRRRDVILSILSDEGLDIAAHRARYGADAFDDVPELAGVARARVRGEPLLRRTGDLLTLTPEGFERSDQIGPYLVSPAMAKRVEESERM